MISYSGEEKISHYQQIHIANLGAPGLTLFPNPNKGKFTLVFSLDQETPVRIQLFNSMGQIVWTKTESLPGGKQNLQCAVPTLAEGTYSLVLQTPAQQWQTHLVIQ